MSTRVGKPTILIVNEWLANTKTNVVWHYDSAKCCISTTIWQPMQKKTIYIKIYLDDDMRRGACGSLIEKRGNIILRAEPIYVTSEEVIHPSIEELLWIGEVEHLIYDLLPYPIYEELSQYRMYFGTSRTIAEIIEEYVPRP
jgi:hypothetical protein